MGDATTKYDSEGGGLMGPMTITHDSMPQTAAMLADEQEISGDMSGNHLATSRLSSNRTKLPPLQENDSSSRNNSRGGHTLQGTNHASTSIVAEDYHSVIQSSVMVRQKPDKIVLSVRRSLKRPESKVI